MDAINKSLTGKAVAPLPDSAESLGDYVFRAWSLLTEELVHEPALALEIELEFELENQAGPEADMAQSGQVLTQSGQVFAHDRQAYSGFDAPPGRGEAPYREMREMHAESMHAEWRISLAQDCIESMAEFEPELPVEFQADEPISPVLDDDAGNMTALPQAPLILRFADAPLRIAPTPVLTVPVSVPVSALVSVPVPAPVAASAIRSTATAGAAAAPAAQNRDRESKPARPADPMRRHPVRTTMARTDSLPVISVMTSGVTTAVTTAVITDVNHNEQSGAGAGHSSNRSSGRALSHKPSAEPAAQVSPRNPQAATTPMTPTIPTIAPNVVPDAASAQPIHALHMPTTDVDSTDVDIRPAATPHETKKALLPQAVFDALPIAQPMPERFIPALPNAPAAMQGNPQSNLQNSPQSNRQMDVASSDGAALPASAGDVAANGGSTLGSTLIYRFDKWGDGHAVTVQSQAQAQAETPHYTLLPSDGVVGQRLSEQLALAAGAADMPLMPMQLTLTEDADERDRQRPPLPIHNEEDEEDV